MSAEKRLDRETVLRVLAGGGVRGCDVASVQDRWSGLRWPSWEDTERGGALQEACTREGGVLVLCRSVRCTVGGDSNPSSLLASVLQPRLTSLDGGGQACNEARLAGEGPPGRVGKVVIGSSTPKGSCTACNVASSSPGTTNTPLGAVGALEDGGTATKLSMAPPAGGRSAAGFSQLSASAARRLRRRRRRRIHPAAMAASAATATPAAMPASMPIDVLLSVDVGAALGDGSGLMPGEAGAGELGDGSGLTLAGLMPGEGEAGGAVSMPGEVGAGELHSMSWSSSKNTEAEL